MPSDGERVAATVDMVAHGYGDRIVHAHDVCTKTQLRRFGGAGYGHIPRKLGPWLRAAGLDEPEVARQLAGNVLTLLGAR
jgi:phosphotriesterase-related protein